MPYKNPYDVNVASKRKATYKTALITSLKF